MPTVFTLSPAHAGGKRAGFLLNPNAEFDTAVRLRKGELTLADVFTFCSGLYFRGKVAYAKRFPDPPPTLSGGYVITTNRGLLPMETPISAEELQNLGSSTIDAADPIYAEPLRRDIAALAAASDKTRFVLLGSGATGKYVDVLLSVLGKRLLFPIDFVGRGDMSRGGLMLRASRSGEELTYTPVQGAVRHGKRPAKLERVVTL